MKLEHIDRSIDYQITGIQLCDLASIAYELDTSPQLPAQRRRELAVAIRLILASALPVGHRKAGGRPSMDHPPSRAQRGARTK